MHYFEQVHMNIKSTYEIIDLKPWEQHNLDNSSKFVMFYWTNDK